MRRLLALVALIALAAPADAAPLRVALLVGNAAGSAGRAPLQHTTRDVLAMRDVLERLGGVSRSFVVLDDSPDALRAAWRELAAVIEPHRDEATVFFYYSGHADDRGLDMSSRAYAYAELRAALEASGARLYVAVVDACQAGALTRAKGGRPVQVVDLSRYGGGAASAQSGGVMITSASPDEASQESDEIGGSFFTHYLLSGLRGAADDSGDRQVSLEEAYRFAYLHTVDRTGETLLGAQHPSWDVDVRGQGQLVLTWLGQGGSYAVLPAPETGRFLVRDRASGRLSAELTKAPGKPLWVALEPGPYEVVRVDAAGVWGAELRIEPGREHTVDPSLFVRRARGLGTVKGGDEASAAWSVAGAMRSGFLQDAAPSWGGVARLRVPLGPIELGPVVGVGHGRWRRSDGLDVSLLEVTGGAFVELIVPLVGAAQARAGVEARAAWAHQTAVDRAPLDGLVVAPAVRAGLLLGVTPPFAIGLMGELGVVMYEGPVGLAAQPTAGVELSIEVRP